MKLFELIVVIIAVSAISAKEADDCDPKKCVLPKCHCSDLNPPIAGKIPQFVSLSFDDSGSDLIYREFYEKVLFQRKNPDKCPISGTFFIPHEYTDYTVVNKLYNHGFEIGSHSITKNSSTKYWNSASVDTIVAEMGGQRNIISKFANIPVATILGARIPHFQLNGDNTYQGLSKAGFLYDSSWSTYTSKPLFPYTLDGRSDQPCPVGTCPTGSIPGMWVSPIINWIDMNNAQCNKLLACEIEGKADELFNWMKTNFERNYKDKRAPVSVLINYAWFATAENSLSALEKFLDHLATLNDVFVVSQTQVIDWMRKPVTADKYSSCIEKRPEAKCEPKVCKLQNNEGADRYMGSCIACPKKYPSIDNPEGK